MRLLRNRTLRAIFLNDRMGMTRFGLAFQGCAALMQAGLLDEVEAYFADPSTDPFEKLAWKSITVMNRYSEMTMKVGSMFGLTSDQIDDLFCFAATIKT